MMGKFHKLTQEFKNIKFKVKTTGELVVILAIVSKGGAPHYLVTDPKGTKQVYMPIDEIEEHLAKVVQLHKPIIAKKAT